jgi:hypothetical protein
MHTLVCLHMLDLLLLSSATDSLSPPQIPKLLAAAPPQSQQQLPHARRVGSAGGQRVCKKSGMLVPHSLTALQQQAP